MSCKMLKCFKEGAYAPTLPKKLYENLWTQPHCATAVGSVRLRSRGKRRPKHRLDFD